MTQAVVRSTAQTCARRSRIEMRTSETKIILADGHPLFRIALRWVFDVIRSPVTLVEARSLASLVRAAAERPAADLVLLDPLLPGDEGLSALEFLRDEYPALRVVVVSALSHPSWRHAARALDAVGFIDKTATLEHFARALQSVLRGDEWWPFTASTPVVHRGEGSHHWESLWISELEAAASARHECPDALSLDEPGMNDVAIRTQVRSILKALDLGSGSRRRGPGHHFPV